MKVFIDIDILIDMFNWTDESSYAKKLLKELMDDPNISLWISAISINHINATISKEYGDEKVDNLYFLIKENFSIIPFRNSTFLRTVDKCGMNFDRAIQIASAEEFNADFIITRDPSNYKNTRIAVFTPDQFLKKRDAGELEHVAHVPFLDLKAQHHEIYNEIDDKITDIILNTGFILGKYVEEFERQFAELQGAKFCLGVSSGTDALHIALLALGIGPGDRVIVPVNTFIATAEAVSLTGAAPVFVDCDDYYNIDVKKLRELLGSRQYPVASRQSNGEPEVSGGSTPIINNNSRITCVIPVHLYGQPANMDKIVAMAEEFELKIVEDCCQAHLAEWCGKKVGNFGAFGAFSFYPGKNLGAYGEAGALITNDEELYIKAKMIRQHGEIERYHHHVIGHNYRMEAIQGAVLSTKLKYLDKWTKKRRQNAMLYNELLSGVEGVQIPKQIDKTYSVYHLYVIQVDDRDDLQEYLQQNKIGTGLHYPIPLHLQDAYRDLGYKEGDFSVAERMSKRILSLPMFPELTEAQIRYVFEKIKEFFKR